MIVAGRRGRDFILRHGETVFNAAGRLQGEAAHTPLTGAGCAQAAAVGRALAGQVAPGATLWASATGRALQTLALVAEPLALDWHAARVDPRLGELGMGSWGGRWYRDLHAAGHRVVEPASGLLHPAPDGEGYPALAERLAGWLADTAADAGDRVVVTHGLAGRVLRGLLLDLAPDPFAGVPAAPGLPQGSAVLVADGRERVVVLGDGQAPA